MIPGGIFCIENWSGDLRPPDSCADILEFLRRHEAARTIHQRVSTPRELGYYLSRFASLNSYGVAYLAMHGYRGKVYVGRSAITLETLIRWASDDGPAPTFDADGKPMEWVVELTGKVLYLGSCASLAVSPQRLERLRDRTGAIAVCGYQHRVDWFEAAGFEIQLLAALAHATSGSRQSVGAAIKRLWKRSETLMETLGFISEPEYRSKA